MPHQDAYDGRTNWQALKAVFADLLPDELANVKRHGNAAVQAMALTAMAMICWGWSKRETLAERVTDAANVVSRLFHVEVITTRQGLLSALAQCDNLLLLIVDQLAQRLAEVRWRTAGRSSFAIDGTKFAAPQTQANEARFAANATRKGRRTRSKRCYQKRSDAKKANTVQLLATVLWHLGSGLPFRWRIEGPEGSERTSLRAMVNELPADARIVGDANFVGYPLWSEIITSGRTFLVRVGSNVTLLKKLCVCKTSGDCVFCWPDSAMRAQQPPLMLRLIVVHNGRQPIYLVTNELDLTDAQAWALYQQRWGVEVFFRTVKQTCQRSKLRTQTPVNVMIELNWTLLGVWSALFVGKRELRQRGVPLARMSPAKVLFAFGEAVLAVALCASLAPRLFEQLAAASNPDESRRVTGKTGRRHARKKKHAPCGKPKIKTATRHQQQLAQHFV